MPGMAWKRAVSSSAIARLSSAGLEPDRIASATLGPTPETDSSCSNSPRSSASANPYSWRASSRTCRYVSRTTSPFPRAFWAARRVG
jgi:hypothetical protein